MAAPSSDSFYESLPVFDEFAGITDPARYQPLPDDWHVVVADVQGSTAAIARGLYKHVNVVGAASITAVLNAVRPLEVPFVFGGDGATLCVPASVVGPVRQALMATRLMAEREFHLPLRVGMVPMPHIRRGGQDVLVARWRISPHCTQAVFSGGGLPFAEACIKDVERGREYRLG